MNEKNTKLVFNQGVARHLIRDYGIHEIDIKPDKNDHKKTIFVFEKTPEFEKAFQEINESIAEARK